MHRPARNGGLCVVDNFGENKLRNIKIILALFVFSRIFGSYLKHQDMKNATEFKAALKATYGIEVKTTDLQKGCIGIQHDEADTIRVRFTARKMGLQYITPEKYAAAYCSNTKANTVIY